MTQPLDFRHYSPSLRRKRRNRLILGLVTVALTAVTAKLVTHSSAPEESTDQTAGKLQLPIAQISGPTPPRLVATPTLKPATQTLEYDIEPGDTLSSIFEELEISRADLSRIMRADEPLLALDTIRPGHRLTFMLNRHNQQLEQMELFIHAGNRVVFEKTDDDLFEYREMRREGEWTSELYAGEVNGSFYVSARKAGLDDKDIFTISRILEEQINFNRDFHAGDQFHIIRSHNTVDGEPTGRSRIEGIRVERRATEHTAFLFDDGLYYDENGDSLEQAFSRLPVANRYRVTSSFAPNRRHPVTGRVAPHNGTDFATPVGTPVRSTGDGVVSRVENHPYAGLYIEIEHNERYSTRYLHLSDALVSRGDTVSRDQKIARSGNTGRTTGPHLHFELHVNGQPVDAMEEDIPQAESVPEEKLASFNRRVAKLTAGMEDEHSLKLATSETIHAPTSQR